MSPPAFSSSVSGSQTASPHHPLCGSPSSVLLFRKTHLTAAGATRLKTGANSFVTVLRSVELVPLPIAQSVMLRFPD